MINWLLRKTEPGVKQAHDVATVRRFVNSELVVVLGLFAVRNGRLILSRILNRLKNSVYVSCYRLFHAADVLTV